MKLIAWSDHWNAQSDKNNQPTKARPTLVDPLACHARSKACLSWRRLSSRWRAVWRRFAAAPAPGPSCDNRSIRHSALARTTVTLKARRISPITLPSWPGPASHPWALLIAATRDSANTRRSLWRSGERSPHSPATSWTSSSPPRSRKRATKGPGGGSS